MEMHTRRDYGSPPLRTPFGKVLLVDDDAPLISRLAALLAASGYWVRAVPDGVQALEIAGADQPDLILLELDLPSVSGFRVVRVLKQQPHAPVILALTCLSFGESRDAIRAGLDGFLTKPVHPADVVTHVDRLLRARATAGLS